MEAQTLLSLLNCLFFPSSLEIALNLLMICTWIAPLSQCNCSSAFVVCYIVVFQLSIQGLCGESEYYHISSSSRRISNGETTWESHLVEYPQPLYMHHPLKSEAVKATAWTARHSRTDVSGIRSRGDLYKVRAPVCRHPDPPVHFI